MSLRHSLRPGSLILALVFTATAMADEVVLVPGSTVKGAIGGRVRGTIQSESPTEVVVKLGATTTNVPAGEIVSIHYDGQPASFALAESRESANQLSEAADLYKKAAAEASGKPFVEQAAQFRQAPARGRAGDGRSGTRGRGRRRCSTRWSRPTRRAGTSSPRSTAWHASSSTRGTTRRSRRRSPRWAQPQSADRAAVLRAKVFDKKGEHDKAIAEYDKPDPGVARGLGPTPRGAAGQGREPRRPQEVRRGRDRRPRRHQGHPARGVPGTVGRL